jgi:NADPH:quinone reductase-like Zn-dependent oxidoreductase
VENGAAVTEFSVGDEISAYVASLASNETYAGFISIPVSLIARKPEIISFPQGTAL